MILNELKTQEAEEAAQSRCNDWNCSFCMNRPELTVLFVSSGSDSLSPCQSERVPGGRCWCFEMPCQE